MRRIGTIVAVLAVLTAGGARAAEQLIGDTGFEVLDPANDVHPAVPRVPWSADGSILLARDGDQSYEVVVDGVQVGAFQTTSGQDLAQAGHPTDRDPSQGGGPNAKASFAFHLPKTAAWSLLILGCGAIGLTLRGGRRVEAGA